MRAGSLTSLGMDLLGESRRVAVPRARRGRSPRRTGSSTGPALALGVHHPGPVSARYGKDE